MDSGGDAWLWRRIRDGASANLNPGTELNITVPQML